MAFQEHDATITPASLIPMPLHVQTQTWIWSGKKQRRFLRDMMIGVVAQLI
jgi:hypothetical protein